MYREWCDLVKRTPATVKDANSIPYLPIEFFKTQDVICGKRNEIPHVFTSSTTTSQIPAKHYVTDIEVYEMSFRKGFNLFYGKPSDYCILALLPNYLERGGSSLVYMADQLIKESGHPLSGFYLNDLSGLLATINELKKSDQRVLLLGVSYALLDMSELVQLNENFIVMETGGMKGRRKEMLKPELHQMLKHGFNVKSIHSEYGMTELLSQAYSMENGVFQTPPWMKIRVRDVDDPFSFVLPGRTGGVNVTDLANYNSCSFIATKDLARINDTGGIELMGRFDYSDVRGCNLMLES